MRRRNTQSDLLPDATDAVGSFAAPTPPRPKAVVFGSIGSGKTALFRSATAHHLKQHHLAAAAAAMVSNASMGHAPSGDGEIGARSVGGSLADDFFSGITAETEGHAADHNMVGGDEEEDQLPPFSGRHAVRMPALPTPQPKPLLHTAAPSVSDQHMTAYAAWGNIAANLRPSTTIEVHDVLIPAATFRHGVPRFTTEVQNDTPPPLGPFANTAATSPLQKSFSTDVAAVAVVDVWDVPGTAAENPTLCTTVLRGAGALAITVDATVMRQVEATFGASALDSAASLAIPWLDAALKDGVASSATSPMRSAAASRAPSRPGTPRGVGGQRRTYPSNAQEEMATVVNGLTSESSIQVPQLHSVVVVVTKIDAVAFMDQDHAMLEALRNVLQTRYQALAPRATFAAFACSAVTGCGVPDLIRALADSTAQAIEAVTAPIRRTPAMPIPTSVLKRRGTHASSSDQLSVPCSRQMSCVNALDVPTSNVMGTSLDVMGSLDDLMRLEDGHYHGGSGPALTSPNPAARQPWLAPTPRRFTPGDSPRPATSSISPSPRRSTAVPPPSATAATSSRVVSTRASPTYRAASRTNSKDSTPCIVA